MQLDIFEHSRDLMLRNDVLHALERRDPAAARAAWLKLEAEYPRDDALPPLGLLLAMLERPDEPPFPDHAEASEALHEMQRDIEAAARRLWGAQAATDWLAPLWRRLAQRAARLDFQAAHAEAHAAALGSGRVTSPRPRTLCRRSNRGAASRFDALTRRLADPLLTRLRRQFDAEFEGDGATANLAWFPA